LDSPDRHGQLNLTVAETAVCYKVDGLKPLEAVPPFILVSIHARVHLAALFVSICRLRGRGDDLNLNVISFLGGGRPNFQPSSSIASPFTHKANKKVCIT
jgi:hypothetical protein